MIEYTDRIDDLTPGMLEGFFEGWPDPPSPARHLALLRASAHAIVAIDPAAGRAVGFVTAISDGVLAAYLPLLEVLPAYRSRGIGRELITRVLARLDHLYMVDLACDPELETFYAPLGFRRGCAMMHRNYDAQSAPPPDARP